MTPLPVIAFINEKVTGDSNKKAKGDTNETESESFSCFSCSFFHLVFFQFYLLQTKQL